VSLYFAECRYNTNFKWLYFRTAGGYDHMLRHASSAICIVHTDLTSTWSKVKVTDLLKFWKLHFSTSTSSAILAWHSQLMGDYDSMGPSLRLFGASEVLISPESTAFYLTLADTRSLWLWLQVGRNKPCMLAAMTISPLTGLFYYSTSRNFLWPSHVIGGPLYFCPVVSSFFLLSFFSSPNLSRCRLDVYHTSTHGVALVQI